MSRYKRIFRVFISSTFDDLIAERNVLHAEVFPAIREYCTERNCQFQPVDLRWGIRREASRDQLTMEMCFAEIARCQSVTPGPNFLVILGDRYGWRPIPATVEASDFEQITDVCGPAARKLLIWSPSARPYEGWYRRDDNAVPATYVLRARGPDPRRLNRGYTMADASEEESAWPEIERRIRSVLLEAIGRLKWPEIDDRRLVFGGSATHQEIARGVFQSPQSGMYALAFSRSISVPPTLTKSGLLHTRVFDVDDAGELDTWAATRLASLKSELRKHLGSRFREYKAEWTLSGPDRTYLTTFSRDATSALRALIQADIDSYEPSTTLAMETLAHEEFGKQRSAVFIGRAELLERAIPTMERTRTTVDEVCQRADYIIRKTSQKLPYRFLSFRRQLKIADWVRRLLELERRLYVKMSKGFRLTIVTGPSGVGKSAFMAAAAQSAKARYPEASVVQRFIGATPTSVHLDDLISGVQEEYVTLPFGTAYAQISEAEYAMSGAASERFGRFRSLLDHIGPSRPLMLFLDAIDQVDEAGLPDTSWLPQPFEYRQRPSHLGFSIPTQYTEIAVSCTPGRWLDALRMRCPDANLIELPAMSSDEAAETLQKWLVQRGRSITPGQRTTVLRGFVGSGLPLHLRLLFEEASGWSSFLPNERLHAAPTVLGALEDMRARVSQDARHGELLVARSLSLLAAARYGLAEQEIAEILAADADVAEDLAYHAHSTPKGVPLPPIAWSRLFHDLEPYMTERLRGGAPLIGFYHHVLSEWAAAAEKGATSRLAHLQLADYFESEPTWFRTGNGPRPNIRKCEELIYHQRRCGRASRAVQLLLSWDFVHAKCKTGLISDLILELKEEQAPDTEDADSRDALQRLERALNRIRAAVSSDLDQLPFFLERELESSAPKLLQDMLLDIRVSYRMGK